MKRRASIPIHSDGRLMRTSPWDTAISILGRRKEGRGIWPVPPPEGDEKAVKHDPAGMIFAVWRRP